MLIGGTMRNKLGIISDVAKLTVASRTKGTQRSLHKTGVKDIMARQGLSLRGSSHGSSVAFTERQSDTKRTVMIIWDLYAWHQS